MTDLLGRVEALEKKVELLEKRLNMAPQEKILKNISIREFLDQLKLKTQTDMVVCIGFYLEKYEGMSSFNMKDLLNGLQFAKEKSPANVNSLINSNISRSFMMESKDKDGKLKRFELTNTGIKFVELNLKSNGEGS